MSGGGVNPLKVAHQDRRQRTRLLERIGSARPCEQRLFWFAEPKRLAFLAYETVGTKRANNLFGRAGVRFDLHGRGRASEADAPASQIRIRMEIGHENIRSALRYAPQLFRHAR